MELLDVGAKVLVCHRRLFPEDQPRFFVGRVDGCENGVAKVTGITWTRDVSHGFHRKKDLRTKLISLHAGTIILYELPREVEVESLSLLQLSASKIALTDGEKFEMDLSERIA